MKQDYFILVLAHSLHGRLRRVHVPHKFVYGVLALAFVGAFSLFGLASSYARMAWKVADYNHLRKEAETLRSRYDNLQKSAAQTKEQLATLQMFATEVSVAYGVKSKIEGPESLMDEARLAPTMSETLVQYQTLQTFLVHRGGGSVFESTGVGTEGLVAGLWPVNGRVSCSYGTRTDPFSGEGAYHTGMDLRAPMGTPVNATGDGTVVRAGEYAGYGRVVVVDHGRGYETYYAHLSRVDVLPGQSVRRGDQVGNVGMSGRSTGPHLHYEVRIGGVPVNPYRFMGKSVILQVAKAQPAF